MRSVNVFTLVNCGTLFYHYNLCISVFYEHLMISRISQERLMDETGEL